MLDGATERTMPEMQCGPKAGTAGVAVGIATAACAGAVITASIKRNACTWSPSFRASARFRQRSAGRLAIVALDFDGCVGYAEAIVKDLLDFLDDVGRALKLRTVDSQV
jgi:hypothetical protein